MFRGGGWVGFFSVFERNGSEFAIVRESRKGIFEALSDGNDGRGCFEEGRIMVRGSDSEGKVRVDGGGEGMRGRWGEKEWRWNEDMVNVGARNVGCWKG